jgi:putative glutamine amidotransferase
VKLGYSPYSYPGALFPFHTLFDSAERLDYTPVDKCDAIILWGGTDINPRFYGEKPHPQNHYQPDSARDVDEWNWMCDAREAKIPIIGICRGAQFLCAFAGGKLIQHMHGHHGNHNITTEDGQTFYASSDHHQALDLNSFPHNVAEYKVIAKADDGVPEIVYFPKVRGLAIQSHPEWEEWSNPIVQYELDLVKKLIEGVL